MITTLLRIALLAVAACLVGGCAGMTDPGAPTYVYVTLKTGPKSGSYSKEQSQEIFAGHMSNMKKLAAEDKLLIAGPFDKPADASWRGLFVFNTRDLRIARDLVATDPGVIAGVFTPELTPMRASASLRDMPALEKALLARQTAPPDPTKPPPNIRAYVLITAQSWIKTRDALAATPAAGRIVWTGSFDGDRAGQGVFVLDADKPETVKAALSGADTGPLTIDGWWSTVSLLGLPAAAGR